MKQKFQKGYRWKQLTEQGLLISPRHPYGELFSEYSSFPDKESAVKEYERISEIYSCPTELVLIEVYENVIDWDYN